jgi:hypothetical protein
MLLDNYFSGISESSIIEHFSNITSFGNNTDQILSFIATEKANLLNSGGWTNEN